MAGQFALRTGILAAVLALVIPAAALSQSFFNSWARCTDVKLPTQRRIDYCTDLLDNGGGPDSEIAVLTVLGALYRDMHQYAKAIDAYSRAIGYEALGIAGTRETVMSPGSAVAMPSSAALIGALAGRAEAYALTGQHDLALADAAEIFKLAPGAATSYAARCRIRAIMKMDLDKALADCGEAAKLAPTNSQVMGAASFLQYRLGHMKEAAADIDAVLNVSPRLASALYMRGVIRLHSGDTAGGNADIAAARAEDPVIADNFADLGVTP